MAYIFALKPSVPYDIRFDPYITGGAQAQQDACAGYANGGDGAHGISTPGPTIPSVSCARLNTYTPPPAPAPKPVPTSVTLELTIEDARQLASLLGTVLKDENGRLVIYGRPTLDGAGLRYGVTHGRYSASEIRNMVSSVYFPLSTALKGIQ